jgi:hypothetical protein
MRVHVRAQACARACNARVRAMRVCVCACACLCVCVHLCACALRVCVRACVSTCACDRAFQSDCIFALVCVASVCVRLAAARPALPSHGGDFAVSMARPAPRVGGRALVVAVRRPPAGLTRVGRRCHVDEPYPQRVVGCAVWAHIRHRRRRRHLRPRRLGQNRPLPGRVGEHRRRCAAGLRHRGDGRWYSGWVLEGYSMGYSRGY